MNDTYERLKAIEIEDYIWILYLVIIFLSFYANELEKKYFLCNDLKAKEDYRKLMILIFAVVLGVYYYFFEDGYKSVKGLTPRDSQNKVFFTNLNFIATILILIAGIIFLFIAVFDTSIETEIAFS